MKTKYLLGLLWIIACVQVAHGALYSYQVIPDVDPMLQLGPDGINNNGEVVGSALLPSSPQPAVAAFRYSQGTTTFFPLANSPWTLGSGINSAGTIVGYGIVEKHPNGDPLQHALYAYPGSGLIDMDNNFHRDSQAWFINDANWVVGQLGNPSQIGFEAFLGYPGGVIIPLGPYVGTDFRPSGLNSNLLIVGNDSNGGMIYNALNNKITSMSFFLGTFNNEARAINASGMVAGTVGSMGYLYSAGSVTYFGTGISRVQGMNANGDVVGNLLSGHAFVYLHSTGQFLDLSNVIDPSISSIWTIFRVGGINDHGVICGSANKIGTKLYQAFKLSPNRTSHPPVNLLSVPPLSP